MKQNKSIVMRLVAASFLVVSLTFGFLPAVHSNATSAAINNSIIITPQGSEEMLTGEAMQEEAPPGYIFPDESGDGSTPDEPLPDPEIILSQSPSQPPGVNGNMTRYVKVSSKAAGFDLGEWLSKAYDVLNATYDPVVLHKAGQQVLAFQRGPLVDELGLSFLEKASLQDPTSMWAANNYAVQKFLIDGTSEKTHGLFEEAHNRALRAGEYDENSIAAHNLLRYEDFSDKVNGAIAELLSNRGSALDKPENRLKLVRYLTLSNRLSEAESLLNEIPLDSPLGIQRQILQGLILKCRRDFKGAAAAFRRAVISLEKSSGIDKEQLLNLERMAAVLDENARAASANDRKTARYRGEVKYASLNGRDLPLRSIRPVSWRATTAQVGFLARITVRARVLNVFKGSLSNVRFFGVTFDLGGAFYNETKNVPVLFYRTVAKTVARADSYTLWRHNAIHPLLVTPLYFVLHPPFKNIRISWNFF